MTCLTKQELENAQRDISDLSGVVNGPVSGTTSTVLTRLGTSIKTLSRVISELGDLSGYLSRSGTQTGGLAKFASNSTLQQASEFTLSDGNAGMGATPAAKLDVNGTIRTVGTTSPLNSGIGLELSYSANVGNILAIDRSTLSYKDINIGLSSQFYAKANGRCGFGTNNPQREMHIAASTQFPFRMESLTSTRSEIELKATSTTSNVRIGASGNDFVINTSVLDRLQISSAGLLRLFSYGSGTLTSDASGNITSSSDINLKERLTNFPLGLNFIKECVEKSSICKFYYNAASGLDRMNEYGGFIAQRVAESAGLFANLVTSIGMDGRLALQDRALLAAAYNAINELENKNSQLEARIANLEGN